jgi:Ca-activated chloride channel family protein
VAFGSEARLVLDRTPAAQKDAIRAALDGLQTYGSTHLEGGLRLGYEVAARNFLSGAINRVLLLSDGVANLGAATAQGILAQVERYKNQGIYCSVFGVGQGTYNDTMLETLADKGDGIYRFVDSLAEARRVFVDDLAANLCVLAKDVKIQVEFDPARVTRYRQIGYENRHLEKEQFRDDTVDAGEVGAGQSAVALYEIVVSGNPAEPLGTARLRWKDVDTGRVEERAVPLKAADRYNEFGQAPVRFRLAAGVAEFADLLRRNPNTAGTTIRDVAAVLRPVGLELSLDQQVQDLVRMVNGVRE